jgi:hypothetical protein
MFFLFISLEFVEFIYRIQTSKNYSFFLFNKQTFLFVKTKYLRYNLLDLDIKIFFLYLDKLLVGYKKYLVSLVIIISLILLGIFNILNILGIRNNYIVVGFVIKVDRFLITGIRGYLVSVLFNIIS